MKKEKIEILRIFQSSFLRSMKVHFFLKDRDFLNSKAKLLLPFFTSVSNKRLFLNVLSSMFFSIQKKCVCVYTHCLFLKKHLQHWIFLFTEGSLVVSESEGAQPLLQQHWSDRRTGSLHCLDLLKSLLKQNNQNSGSQLTDQPRDPRLVSQFNIPTWWPSSLQWPRVQTQDSWLKK